MRKKFLGAENKCLELAERYAEVCRQLNCHFFDSNAVISASKVDGIHLDQPDHLQLGIALAEKVGNILKT